MLATFVSIYVVFLVALVAIQWTLVAIYCRELNRVDPNPDRSYQPPAVVVLCLRGADPYLSECVGALLNLDYPDFRILCVIDSPEDPSRTIIERYDDPRIHLVVSKTPDGQSGLKNNALVTAFEEISKHVEVVALVDADTIVDPHWLADLVAPLNVESNVVATGNRWYTPPDSRLGTVVRYLWYLAGSVQMYIYKIPWGGSLAIRHEYVMQTDLLDTWSRSLFEDTLLTQHTKSNGKRVAMVPGLLIPNSESIDLSGTVQWMRRQLLNTRLYHKRFPWAVTHCLATMAAHVIPTVLILVCLVSSHWTGLWVSAIAVGVYQMFYYFVLKWLEKRARQVMELRFQELTPSPHINVSWLARILVTQMTYFVATWGAIWQRSTRWRGVTYAIHGPFAIEVLQDEKPGDSPRLAGTLSPEDSQRQSIER